MPADYRIFLFLAPFIAVVTVGATVLVWVKRTRPGARYLWVFAAAATGFLISNTLELASRGQAATLMWARIEHIFAAMVPVGWILFVFDFTERNRWIRASRFWPFLVIPVADIVFTFTNGMHHLIWQSLNFVRVGPLLALQVVHGPAYFVTVAFSYLVLVGGLLIVMRDLAYGRGIYRKQLIWISTGIVVPIVSSAAYTYHFFSWLNKDYTPVGFAVGAIMFMVAVFRTGFLDLSPPSRNRLFDALSEGIVVVDAEGRVVDLNRSAMGFLGITESALGKKADTNEQIAPLLRSVGGGARTARSGLTIRGGDGARHFELSAKRLRAAEDGRDGVVLLIHDITERVQLTEEIRTLRGIVPICARCKKIRDDGGFWQSVEAYISSHSYAEFTHGLCPECIETLYPAQPAGDEAPAGNEASAANEAPAGNEASDDDAAPR